MGLGGRKVKQRIGADPRNLTWADDAAKFGQAYLSKLGWDPSKGLGTQGDGRTSHIKVAQKLNLLGIGAGRQEGMADESIAWKQNREYEMLLKRLNEGLEVQEKEDAGGGEVNDGEEVKERKKRKKGDDVEDERRDEKKKRREERKEKREKKEKRNKRKDRETEGGEDETATSKPERSKSPDPPPAPAIQAPIPRPMAHRARFLRSKQLASRSSTALSEILGISSSASNSPGPSSLGATPYPPSSLSPTPTPTSAPTPNPETDQELRTSSTNVKDYFKEKLAARALVLARGNLVPKVAVPEPSRSSSSEDVSSRPPVVTTSSPSPTFSSNNSPPSGVAARVSRSKSSDNTETEVHAEVTRAGLGSRGVREFSTTTGNGAGAGDHDAPRSGTGMGAKFGSLMGGFTGSILSPTSASQSRMGGAEVPSVSSEPPAVKGKDDEPGSRDRKSGSDGGMKKKKGKKEKRKQKRDGEVRDKVSESTENVIETIDNDPAVSDSSDEKKQREKANSERKENKKKRKEKKAKWEGDSAEKSSISSPGMNFVV